MMPSGVKVYLASQPVDYRKGLDSLLSLVRNAGSDPFSGALYVFRAKRADRMRIAVIARHEGGIGPHIRCHEVGADADGAIARPAANGVIFIVKRVFLVVCDQPVVACAAVNLICVAVPGLPVITAATVDGVVVFAAKNGIVRVATDEHGPGDRGIQHELMNRKQFCSEMLTPIGQQGVAPIAKDVSLAP